MQHLGTSREELDWLQHLEELLGRRCGELRAAAEVLSKAPETAPLCLIVGWLDGRLYLSLYDLLYLLISYLSILTLILYLYYNYVLTMCSTI